MKPRHNVWLIFVALIWCVTKMASCMFWKIITGSIRRILYAGKQGITKRVFPELFQDIDILPIDDYPTHLHDMLSSIAPHQSGQVTCVVLTPAFIIQPILNTLI